MHHLQQHNCISISAHIVSIRSICGSVKMLSGATHASARVTWVQCSDFVLRHGLSLSHLSRSAPVTHSQALITSKICEFHVHTKKRYAKHILHSATAVTGTRVRTLHAMITSSKHIYRGVQCARSAVNAHCAAAHARAYCDQKL